MDPSVQQRETGNSLCFAAAHFYKHDSNHPQQKKNQHTSICSESTALMSVRFGVGIIELPMNWSSVAKCYSEIYATTPPLRSPPLPSQVTALRVKENGWKEGKKNRRENGARRNAIGQILLQSPQFLKQRKEYFLKQNVAVITQKEKKESQNKTKNPPQNPWYTARGLEKNIFSLQAILPVCAHPQKWELHLTHSHAALQNPFAEAERALPALHGHKEGCAALSKRYRMQQEIGNGLGNGVLGNRCRTFG